VSLERKPLAALRVALQCGGSDSFSGVSGKSPCGRDGDEVFVTAGSGVVCAETDELCRAES